MSRYGDRRRGRSRSRGFASESEVSRGGPQAGGVEVEDAIPHELLEAAVDACAKDFRGFARQAASLLSQAPGQGGKAGDSHGPVDEVMRKVQQLLELEESRGRQLAELRNRGDDLHRRLRVLVPGGLSAAARTQTPRPMAVTGSRGCSLPRPLGAGGAVAPWASRRTTRPRLLG
ncbi:unnamed protein product [Polarella glacialis]|uniref:Uncharacterized protein n=1 Tax=Polarella glacialis TaxID=89957 RepID=A0A813FPW4_POLGL|nr:unnamed protein product [Polarella glacialis]CAE8717924.1 unnamed protein product [Polarella glacialis]